MNRHEIKMKSNTRHRRLILAVFRCLICAVAALLSASPSQAADRSIWQMLPYDVKIIVALDPAPPLTPQLREELLTCLNERIEQTIGSTWNTTIEPAPSALRGAMLRDIDAVTPEQIKVPYPAPDKILLLAVKCLPDGLEVNARDFDIRTNIISSPVSRPVCQIGVLGDAMLDAVLSCFAPLAYIDGVKKIINGVKQKQIATIRPKASALPPRDPNLVFINKDDVFWPIKRINDRDGNLRQAEPVPWTFLTVDKNSPGETLCTIHTGLRTPIHKRGGRRVEMLALRVIPTKRSTVLSLKSRTAPHEPLFGYYVYSRVPGKKAATLLGRTDRRGRFVVPPGDHLIRVLLIRNGREPLARMPMVPGLEKELSTEIAKDDLRLWTEGYIFGLQEELVDIVVRRIIYMTLIRVRMDEGKIKQAEKMLEDLRELPDAMQLTLRVSREGKRLETNDYIVQRKIGQFINDTVQLIHQHLDPSELTELEDDFKLAKADAEREAAEKAEDEAEDAKDDVVTDPRRAARSKPDEKKPDESESE